jgi:hypothetical protein
MTMNIRVRLARKGGTIGEQEAGTFYGHMVDIVNDGPEGNVYGVVVVGSGEFTLKPLGDLRAVDQGAKGPGADLLPSRAGPLRRCSRAAAINPPLR